MIFTNSLVNCEYIKIYIIINEIIVSEVCKQLQIDSYPLSKSKSLRDYNKQLIEKFITHYLLPILNVHDYKKNLCFILIVKIKQYDLILEKS